MNERQQYMYHLDDLRRKKNVSIKEICKDICSDRQYRKYMSGTNNISDVRILEFLNVLSISSRDFYYTLSQKNTSDYKSIKDVYVLLTKKMYSEVDLKLKKLSSMSGRSKQNNRFLGYIDLRFNYEMRRDNNDVTITKIKKLIPYPDCIDCDAYDYVDILLLLQMAKIEVSSRKTTALNILLRILLNENLLYLSAENRNILPPIYANTTIMMGKLGMFEECILLANMGIEYCKKHSYSSSLTWLYYSLAIANKKLQKTNIADKYVTLCISSAISNNDTRTTLHFYNLLTKDFEKDPFKSFEKYKSKILDIGEKTN